MRKSHILQIDRGKAVIKARIQCITLHISQLDGDKMGIKGEFHTRAGDKVTLDDVVSLLTIMVCIGFLLFIERFL